ncbi:hypothetical protein BU24DRAFT_65861 [Aaosphaeria arxii CBS 175.79]|uniref:Uncharacterized protein n=1 Tax=Aaosphaeria arxii CBS 175.79 TaxID=1450172 RepID=A0A6A5XAH5_9PLEO|nr:uncharacterized protein BU24DRAFT_65861 [Aaosphaeria arxii CBS 175.79]KAF2009856.1 hypothetical protein BU24DRAFT_65861 [Aaosphaeria arxii CBS 175.79]
MLCARVFRVDYGRDARILWTIRSEAQCSDYTVRLSVGVRPWSRDILGMLCASFLCYVRNGCFRCSNQWIEWKWQRGVHLFCMRVGLWLGTSLRFMELIDVTVGAEWSGRAVEQLGSLLVSVGHGDVSPNLIYWLGKSNTWIVCSTVQNKIHRGNNLLGNFVFYLDDNMKF